MALALTPRLLRRGLELFALISLAGVGGLLFYGNNFEAFAHALFSLHWGWLVVGLGLASMDWIGGGTRLWVVARHVHPGVRLRDMILRTQLNAGDALEMNREFQNYLSHYGETQKVALEILEKIAASVPENS